MINNTKDYCAFLFISLKSGQQLVKICIKLNVSFDLLKLRYMYFFRKSDKITPYPSFFVQKKYS